MIETTYSQDGSESKTSVSGRRIETTITHSATQSSSLMEQTSIKIEDIVSHGIDSGRLLLTENAASLIVASGSVETKIDLTAHQATIKSENPLSHFHYVEPTIDSHYVQKKYVDSPEDGKRYIREGARWVEASFQESQLKIQRIVATISGTDPTEVEIPEPYTAPPVVLFNHIEGDGVTLIDANPNKIRFRGEGKIQIFTMGI